MILFFILTYIFNDLLPKFFPNVRKIDEISTVKVNFEGLKIRMNFHLNLKKKLILKNTSRHFYKSGFFNFYNPYPYFA